MGELHDRLRVPFRPQIIDRETPPLLEWTGTNRERAHDEVETVYRETRDSLSSYLRYLGLSSAGAEEVLQETYFRLYKELLRRKPIENRKAWLFRVAHNEGLKARKRDKAPASGEADLSRFVHPGDSPERQLLNREQMDRVTQALRSLSPQQRECVYLRAEGLKFREIAETLGVTISTVNEFIRRALERMAQAVND